MHMLELMEGTVWRRTVRTEPADMAQSPTLMGIPGRETAQLETQGAVKEREYIRVQRSKGL